MKSIIKKLLPGIISGKENFDASICDMEDPGSKILKLQNHLIPETCSPNPKSRYCLAISALSVASSSLISSPLTSTTAL